MSSTWRWILFGVLALLAIVGLVLLGANKKLRQRISGLLLERFIKNKVSDLKEKAVKVQTLAEQNKIDAKEAEQQAKEIEEAIEGQKEALQQGLEKRGLDADEISNRFNNLSI